MHPQTTYTEQWRRRKRGFTLVEIMIVVVIIGFLAALAIPAFERVRRRSQNTRFANDLRQMRAAIEMCTMENGDYPPDGLPANFPAILADYLPPTATSTTPIGGQWDWDYNVFGFKAAMAVVGPTISASQALEIDQLIDDGNLGTGNFRSYSNGYTFVMAF